MSDLPPEAGAAIRLDPGELITNSWWAMHRCGPATRAIPGFPMLIEGYLVLTNRRLVFIQETGTRFSKGYSPVAALYWPLSSLREVTSSPGQGSRDKTTWLMVQGEYFSVGKGSSQENGRVQWLIERARTASSPAKVAPGKQSATIFAVPAPLPSPPPGKNGASGQPVAPMSAQPTAPANSDPPPAPAAKQEVRSSVGQGLSHPGQPTWPMVPMTIVEASDPDAFWRIVGSSGVDRSKLLVVCTESPGEISASYGLAGAILWRLTRIEGERKVSPADADKLGYILSEHLEKESGQAIVLKGLDRVIEESSFRTTRNLLDMLRETAERTRGAVIIFADSVVIGQKELHQLEDDVKVLRL